MFQHHDLKKLAPSKLEIGTSTTDTVKLVGSCVFYLVHPDTKHLQEVTFYVSRNNGSVVLSCVTTLTLGLIQPCTRLDYLPPRASLITSSSDHPEKTKFQLNVQVSKQESVVSNQNSIVPKLITSKDQIIKLPKLHIHQITNQLSARSDSLNQMRIATQEDDVLALLKHTIMYGWPSTMREVPNEIQPYWTFREELTNEDGIVLRGT